MAREMTAMTNEEKSVYCASELRFALDEAELDGNVSDAAVLAAGYAFNYPLVAMYSTMLLTYFRADDGSVVGDIIHFGAPLGPGQSLVRRPPASTVFSSGFMDTIDQQSYILTTPQVPSDERLFTVQILDGYTNQVFPWVDNTGVNGSDTSGNAADKYLIIGSNHVKLPAGVTKDYTDVFTCKTRYCWILARFSIGQNTTEEIEQIQKYQNQLTLQHASADGQPPVESAEAVRQLRQQILTLLPLQSNDIVASFDLGNTLSIDSPPPDGYNEKLLLALEARGIGPGQPPFSLTLEQFSEEDQEKIRDIGTCFPIYIRSISIDTEGWTYFGQSLGDYKDDYIMRARIALLGLGAQAPQQETYASNSLPYFNGSKSFKMEFEPGNLPKTRGPWSITVYNDDGQLVANPWDRYALNSDSPQLNISSTGGLTLLLQSYEPKFDDGNHSLNWIPTKYGEKFNLLARFNLPDESIANGTWKIPDVIEMVEE